MSLAQLTNTVDTARTLITEKPQVLVESVAEMLTALNVACAGVSLVNCRDGTRFIISGVICLVVMLVALKLYRRSAQATPVRSRGSKKAE